MLAESSKLSEAAKDASVRKRGKGAPNDEARAMRAEQLTSLGELFAARGALESAVVAPGTLATLAESTIQCVDVHDQGIPFHQRFWD